jgi:hypothetical protein
LNNICRPPLTLQNPESGWTGSISPACGFSAQFTYCSYSGSGPSCPGTRTTISRHQLCN